MKTYSPKQKRDSWDKKDWSRYGKILNILVQKEMTPLDLANLINTDVRYVSAILWGIRKPRKKEEAIANALGVEWDDLFKEVG